MKHSPIRVVVADDHPLFCASLANIIAEIPGVLAVEKALTGFEAIEKLHIGKIDLLFLDIDMPGMNGFQVIHRLQELKISTPVVVISMHANPLYFSEMYVLGVKGYILKNTSVEELTDAISAVVNGSEFYSPEVLKVIKGAVSKLEKRIHPERPTSDFITSKEREVVKLICEQLSAKEIADRLGVSEKTVKRHKQNLLEKTGAKNQVGLAVYAIQNGFHL